MGRVCLDSGTLSGGLIAPGGSTCLVRGEVIVSGCGVRGRRGSRDQAGAGRNIFDAGQDQQTRDDPCGSCQRLPGLSPFDRPPSPERSGCRSSSVSAAHTARVRAGVREKAAVPSCSRQCRLSEDFTLVAEVWSRCGQAGRVPISAPLLTARRRASADCVASVNYHG